MTSGFAGRLRSRYIFLVQARDIARAPVGFDPHVSTSQPVLSSPCNEPASGPAYPVRRTVALVSTPTSSRTRSCARVANGNAAALPRTPEIPRCLMSAPRLRSEHRIRSKTCTLIGAGSGFATATWDAGRTSPIMNGHRAASLEHHLVGAAEQRQWDRHARALGVLRFMINSTFVDCCTGGSAGLSLARVN